MDIDRILLHLSEMLLDRGEDIAELVEHADAVERARYFNEVIELNTDRTTIFFAMTKDQVKSLLQKTLRDCDEPEALVERSGGRKNFLVVIGDVLTSTSNANLQQRDKRLAAMGGMFQVFQAKELAYNPTRHELVPRHERLTDAEAREVLDRYMVRSRAKMPIISRMDIMARWLGLRPGDIVRITRHSDTSGEYYYYRCCL